MSLFLNAPMSEKEGFRKLSTSSLSRAREIYMVTGRFSPAEIADRLMELPEDRREEAAKALALIEEGGAMFRPFLRNIDRGAEEAEIARPPRGAEPRTVSLASMTVLIKQSKLSYDLRKRNVSKADLFRQYAVEGTDVRKVVASHRAHSRSVKMVKDYFEARGVHGRFYVLDEQEPASVPGLIRNAQVVVIIGGDDHLKDAVQYVTDQCVLAINSDPKRSTGALCYFRAHDFESLAERLSKGEFLIEDWPRLAGMLETAVNGHRVKVALPPACSEVSVADEKTLYTMRGMLMGVEEHALKGSGLLVATGAGSTGWYTSAAKYIYPFGHHWLRTISHAEYIHREPYGTDTEMDAVWGTLDNGEELHFTSSSNHSPEISVDSVWSYPFPRGSELMLRFSTDRLKVISNQVPGARE